MSEEQVKDVTKALKKASGVTPRAISAVSGAGTTTLLTDVFKMVDARREAEKAEKFATENPQIAAAPWSP